MIKNIIILQKQELDSKAKERYIMRKSDFGKTASSMIKVIIGPRRAGKSFFAVHFLKAQGNFGYVNFDDEQLAEAEDYDEIVNAMNSVYGNPKTVLFDEIQNLPKWELFANRLQRQGYNLVITGSNSKLLSKELAAHLTGRHFLINIFPFSFREYLNFVKGETGRDLTTSEIKEKLSEYIVYGGYPEPLVKKMDYKEYLSTLFNSIVYKDIVKRHRIRFANEIEDMAFYLLSNIASEYSYNSLAKVTKIKSVHTLQKYAGYLEEAFIFFSISRFSYKVKEQISSIKKLYCFDNGFVYSKAFQGSPNEGKLYENAVASELKKEEMDNKLSVYYWKNVQQEEVDFVVKKGTKVVQLIQVCFDVRNPKAKDREVRALIKASKELKCKDLLVITENYSAEESKQWFGMKGKIKFVPLHKWLLEG